MNEIKKITISVYSGYGPEWDKFVETILIQPHVISYVHQPYQTNENVPPYSGNAKIHLKYENQSEIFSGFYQRLCSVLLSIDVEFENSCVICDGMSVVIEFEKKNGERVIINTVHGTEVADRIGECLSDILSMVYPRPAILPYEDEEDEEED